MPTGLVLWKSADKWKPSQTFLETSLLSSCRFSCLITTVKDLHQVLTKCSTVIFQALEVLIPTFFPHSEVWALVETVDLVINDNQQQLVAIATRLFPVEFYSRTCDTYC